jgi:hypothetical protein
MDINFLLSNKLREYFEIILKLLFLIENRIIIATKEDKVFEFERNLKTLITLKLNKIDSKSFSELSFLKPRNFQIIPQF